MNLSSSADSQYLFAERIWVNQVYRRRDWVQVGRAGQHQKQDARANFPSNRPAKLPLHPASSLILHKSQLLFQYKVLNLRNSIFNITVCSTLPLCLLRVKLVDDQGWKEPQRLPIEPTILQMKKLRPREEAPSWTVAEPELEPRSLDSKYSYFLLPCTA